LKKTQPIKTNVDHPSFKIATLVIFVKIYGIANRYNAVGRFAGVQLRPSSRQWFAIRIENLLLGWLHICEVDRPLREGGASH
jgi:hypothetical protein